MVNFYQVNVTSQRTSGKAGPFPFPLSGLLSALERESLCVLPVSGGVNTSAPRLCARRAGVCVGVSIRSPYTVKELPASLARLDIETPKLGAGIGGSRPADAIEADVLIEGLNLLGVGDDGVAGICVGSGSRIAAFMAARRFARSSSLRGSGAGRLLE